MNSTEFIRTIVLPRLQAAPEVVQIREWGIFRRGWTITLASGEQFEISAKQVGHQPTEHTQVGPEAGWQ